MRLAPKLETPPTGKLPSWRDVYADLESLRRRDWQNVQDGLYPPPEPVERTLPGAAQRSISFFKDLGAVNRRRAKGRGREVFEAGGNEQYPGYYLQNFHYQSGGYLTPESASLYDHQVEVLFVGGADTMRRQALAATAAFLQRRSVRTSSHLDIACGTGRFLEMLKDAHPRLRVTGIDLSHPYLQTAQGRLSRWSRTALLQGNAEALPFADATFESLSCIFLFHELPHKIRRRVTEEMVRVLKPGGHVSFLDSMQLGDRPDFDALLERFPIAFHEPYYHDFIRADLDKLFESAGLSVRTAERAFFAKLVVLEKPHAP